MSKTTSTKTVKQLETEVWKMDQQRKKAWKNYFELRENLVNERRKAFENIKVLQREVDRLCETDEGRYNPGVYDGMFKIIERQSKQLKESLTCPICSEENLTLDNLSVTKCGHIFCTECLKKWTSANDRCPLCREVIKVKY